MIQGGDDMVDGLNDKVEIFGRVFHVQTEITSGPDPVLQARVFLDGEVVASREVPATPADDADESTTSRLQTLHAQIIENLVNRDIELAAWPTRQELDETVPGWGHESARPTPDGVQLPDPDSDAKLQNSLAVRKLIGPFSYTFKPSPFHDPPAVRARLGKAADMIDEIMTASAFEGIRIDEQVRFFDLRERLAGWRGSGHDPDLGAEILLAVVAFAGHLRQINDRRELVVFDHALITWALSELGRNGDNDEVLLKLRSLAGRDVDLDQVLQQPDEFDQQHLLEALLRLLDRTHP
jgi:hypothetical protein